MRAWRKVTSSVSLGSVLVALLDVCEPAVAETKTITGSKVTEGVKSEGESEPGGVTIIATMDPILPPSSAPRTLSAGMIIISMPEATPTIITATSTEDTPLVLKDLPFSSDVPTLRSAPAEIPEMSGESAGGGTGEVAEGSDRGAPSGYGFTGVKTELKVRDPLLGSKDEL